MESVANKRGSLTNGNGSVERKETVNVTQPQKVSIRERLKHFTFAWFLSTMSTGGLAIALGETPHKFKGLYTIGLIVFFFDIALFTILVILTTTRLVLHPSHVRKAFTNPSEMLFLGSFWLSISVILGAIQSYGLTHGPRYPWLITTIYVLYWMYATCSLANTIAQFYILIASTKIQRPVQFSPAFFLIGYSAMLTGTIASLIAPTQPAHRAEMLIISGLTFKGYGWIISLICIVYFIRNLIDNGLPPPSLRPGLFIPVGSVAYTIITFIGLARAIPQHPETGYFAAHPDAREILNVMALWVSVFMWLFSFFLFAVAVLANVGGARKMGFSLVWWAFIFPNVGFTLGTGMIGVELGSEAIEWFASILTVLLLAIWIVALVGCVRAVWKGQIVWPGKDEDKNV